MHKNMRFLLKTPQVRCKNHTMSRVNAECSHTLFSLLAISYASNRNRKILQNHIEILNRILNSTSIIFVWPRHKRHNHVFPISMLHWPCSIIVFNQYNCPSLGRKSKCYQRVECDLSSNLILILQYKPSIEKHIFDNAIYSFHRTWLMAHHSFVTF